MSKQKKVRLVLALSSRVVFDLEQAHQVFEEQGEQAYQQYHLDHQEQPLKPGPAFAFMNKMNKLSKDLGDRYEIHLVLISKNSHETGLRAFNAFEATDIELKQAIFTQGGSTINYLNELDVDLFLTADSKSASDAVSAGIAAAKVMTLNPSQESSSLSLNIAFDADAVVFSDEAEKVFEKEGIEKFRAHENQNQSKPLQLGPFAQLLSKLNVLKQIAPESLKLLLITARTLPAHKRLINSLEHYGLKVDTTAFTGGNDKTPILKGFGADIFFDDNERNINNAADHIASGHVPRAAS